MVDNIESEFYMNQKVKIETGLYANNYGKVVGKEKDKYQVKIVIDGKELIVNCTIKQIRKQKGLFGK